MGTLEADLRRESGMTLIEMMVAMVLVLAVLPIVGPMMISSLRAGEDLRVQSEVVDELRVQVSQVARELRSAECIYEPAENTSGTVLRFTTNANGAPYEVKYEITGGSLVRTRGTVVRKVGKGLVAGSAFEQIANPRRSVGIDLVVQLDVDHDPKELATTVAGRNAWRTC